MIMREVAKCKIEIQKHADNGGKILLMLDFDGTISPIMPRPEQAYLPIKTQRLFEAINKFCLVAIVSGRPKSVIEEKIGTGKFIYVGSHGLELSLDKKNKLKHISKKTLTALGKIEENLNEIHRQYPELILEKKPYSVTFHYKLVSRGRMRIFRAILEKFIAPIYKNNLFKVFWDKETVEILPQLGENKGRAVTFVHRYFQAKTNKKLLPIYIGDAETDEDAFEALKKNGITIRVGKSKKSSANYYIKSQKQVDEFLEWLAGFLSC